jgi:spermidine synthase
VKQWRLVDKTLAPDGKTVSLHEHDGSYTIRVDGAQLMSTRQHASEEKLAEAACAQLGNRRGARVLIGGLGFGFTLKACLAAVAPDAKVVVAEILGAVIAWNRNPDFHLASGAIADARVTVREQDVREVIEEEPNGFDSIILDIDNGPDALSTAGNAGLYQDAGLRSARRALRPGGCTAFWSVAPDRAFEKRLTSAGFTVEVLTCRSRPNAGGWHTLYIGRAMALPG